MKKFCYVTAVAVILLSCSGAKTFREKMIGNWLYTGTDCDWQSAECAPVPEEQQITYVINENLEGKMTDYKKEKELGVTYVIDEKKETITIGIMRFPSPEKKVVFLDDDTILMGKDSLVQKFIRIK